MKFSRRGQRFPVWFGVSRCSRMDAWARGTPRQVGHAEMPQSCAGTPSRHPREWRSFLGGALTAGRPRGTEWTATERRGRRPSDVDGDRADTEDHNRLVPEAGRSKGRSRWRGRQLGDGHVPTGVPISQCRSLPVPVAPLQAANPPRPAVQRSSSRSQAAPAMVAASMPK